MKLQIFLLTSLLLSLASCFDIGDNDVTSLGDDFVLYKNSNPYTDSVGFHVGGGGIQGLIDGEIDSYGYNSRFVVVKMKNESYYFFEKSVVKKSAQPTFMVKGPLDIDAFEKKTSELSLPSLMYKPKKSR